MSKSRDAVEDIRTIDTVTATANAALPKAGGALTGTVTNFTSTGIDDNATSTAITIDASENVMVGQTSVNTANNGHSFGANGNYAHHTSTESTTLILNRKTSNGDIVRLRKDNAAVGSIGTLGGATYFGSADSGIMFNGVNQNPTNGTSTRVDNTNDLGASSYRYKDIYLGGGAFLGGTATANKLEDYETGTWTPNIGGNATYTNQVGRYIKIGKMVWINFALGINVQGTGSTISSISGLPFASGEASQNTSNLAWHGLGVAMTYGVYYIGAGQSALSLSYTTGAATQLTNNPNSLVNGSSINGSFAYSV